MISPFTIKKNTNTVMKSVLLSSGSQPTHRESRKPGLGTAWSPADGSWHWWQGRTGHSADTLAFGGLQTHPISPSHCATPSRAVTTRSEPGKGSSPCKPALCHPQLPHKPSREGHFPADAATSCPVGGPHEQVTGANALMDRRILCHISPSTSLPPLPSLWDLLGIWYLSQEMIFPASSPLEWEHRQPPWSSVPQKPMGRCWHRKEVWIPVPSSSPEEISELSNSCFLLPNALRPRPGEMRRVLPLFGHAWKHQAYLSRKNCDYSALASWPGTPPGSPNLNQGLKALPG